MDDRAMLGRSGELAVRFFFNGMNWTTAEPSPDNGIDLVAHYRGEGDFGYLPTVYVQVKTGESYLKPSKDHPGSFRISVDKRHYDLWTTMSAPTLLVVVDPGSGLMYWSEINHNTTSQTGKQYAVYVPESNRLDQNANDKLLLACKKYISRIRNHGAEKVDQSSYLPAELPRMALLNPWVFSSQLSVDKEDYGAVASAISGCQDLRVIDLDRQPPGKRSQFHDQLDSEHWPWRAAGAIAAYLGSGTTQPIYDLTPDGTEPGQTAATCILQSAVLLQRREVVDAISKIQNCLERTDIGNANRLWVTVQKSRAQYHQGDFTAAHESAQTAIEMYDQVVTSDLTCDYLKGNCHQILARLLGPWREDRTTRFQAMNNTIAWRSENETHAMLSNLYTQRVSDSLRNGATTFLFGRRPDPSLELAASSLRGSLAGDDDCWRTSHQEFATDAWEKCEDQGAFCLKMMYEYGTFGEDKLAMQCAKAIVEQHRINYSEIAFDAFHPEKSTHLSARADIAVLRELVEVMDPAYAGNLAKWVTETMICSEGYRNRVFCQFDLVGDLTELLCQLHRSHSNDIDLTCLAASLEKAESADDSVEAALVKAASSLPASVLKKIDVSIFEARCNHNSPEIANTAVRVLANLDDENLQRYLAEAVEEDYRKLHKIRDFAVLEGFDLTWALEQTIDSCNELLDLLDEGTRHGCVDSPFALLCRLNLYTQSGRDWSPLTRLLQHPNKPAIYIVPALDVLNADDHDCIQGLPQSLRSAVQKAFQQRFSRAFFDFDDALGPLGELAYRLGVETADSVLTVLLGESAVALKSAINVMSLEPSNDYMCTMKLLMQHENRSVRAAAAAGLVKCALASGPQSWGHEHAEDLCLSAARAMSVSILNLLHDSPTSQLKTRLLQEFVNSPYVQVGHRAEALLANATEET